MRVPLPPQQYRDAARRNAFFQELLPRVRAVPGVEAAGLNSGLHPLGGMRIAAELQGNPSNEPVLLHHVDAGYVNALGIRLAAGRMLTDADVDAAQPVALVNEQPVRHMIALHAAIPVGQRTTVSEQRSSIPSTVARCL